MLSTPYHYVALCIVLVICVIAVYIRFKYQFWSIQPVFHLWDLHHWIFTNRVISPDLPGINKYVKLLDVQSIDVKNASDEHLTDVCDFIKENYLRSKLAEYNPEKDNILSYLDTNLGKSFISVYSKTKNNLTTEKELLGVITARPIFLNFSDGTSIVANYVDNLTVRKDSRKQGIAPRLIQTHIYQTRRMGANPVCFFKREGDMTAIVPLTTFQTSGYRTDSLPTLKFNVPNCALVSVKKTNVQPFIDLMKSSEKDYECTVNTELTTVLSLIATGQLAVYCVILNGEAVACYVFRNTPSIMKEANGNSNIAELICSVNKAPFDDIFYTGYVMACKRLKKRLNVDIATIEELGDNCNLARQNARNGIAICTSCPTAFFLYNYSRYSIKPEKIMCLY